MNDRVRQAPERNLALELVRVTEASALAAARGQGRGDVDDVDSSASNAMRVVLNTLQMDGTVVIGGLVDENIAGIRNGQRVGNGDQPRVDVAIDAVDGTMLVAQGRSNALAVVAVSEQGSMFDPGPCRYMEKIVVGPDAVGVVDLDRPAADNIRAVAKAKNENVGDVTVVILDRPRHHDLIAEVRSAGARIQLIQDGDISGALSAVWPGAGADILYGIGGTAEGVIAAAALKCMGGELQGRIWVRNKEDRQRVLGAGYDLELVLTQDDLVRNDNCFFAATGITDSYLMRGVQYDADSATTDSMVMRSKSGTVRRVQAQHRLSKLAKFSEVDYE